MVGEKKKMLYSESIKQKESEKKYSISTKSHTPSKTNFKLVVQYKGN